jgi:hypothetical protein
VPPPELASTSKIVKIVELGAVFAGQRPEYPRGISTDSTHPTRDERRRPADLGAVPDALGPWPTLAAAWIDPASWLLRIMARGHTPAEAEARAASLPAYAAADPAHIDLFVRANVRMWNEIEETNGRPWAKIMAHTARTWAQHRGIGVLSARTPRRSRVGSRRAL